MEELSVCRQRGARVGVGAGCERVGKIERGVGVGRWGGEERGEERARREGKKDREKREITHFCQIFWKLETEQWGPQPVKKKNKLKVVHWEQTKHVASFKLSMTAINMRRYKPSPRHTPLHYGLQLLLLMRKRTVIYIYNSISEYF